MAEETKNKASKGWISKVSDWRKNMPAEKRGFWASVLLAFGVAIVVNSDWILLSLIGIVPFVFGYWIAPLRSNKIFWSRTPITLGFPLLAFGGRIVYSSLPISVSSSLFVGLLLVVLALVMIVLGFCSYFIDKAKNRKKLKAV